MKPEAREKMRTLPSDRKWVLLCQDKYKVRYVLISCQEHAAAADPVTLLPPSQDDVKQEKNDPLHWSELLSKEQVTIRDLQTLRVVLGSQGKSWLSQFVDQGGLLALLSLLNKDMYESSSASCSSLLCMCSFYPRLGA